jgi:hypothetical protein
MELLDDELLLDRVLDWGVVEETVLKVVDVGILVVGTSVVVAEVAKVDEVDEAAEVDVDIVIAVGDQKNFVVMVTTDP